jgi:hypothetical protein
MGFLSKFFCLAMFCMALVSCANKPPVEEGLQPEPVELDFRPLVLKWKADTPEAEADSSKDSCVIQITATLMREPLVVKSKVEELEYLVVYGKEGESLVFEGFVTDKAVSGKPEAHWTATCGKGEKVVVNFHNGQ